MASKAEIHTIVFVAVMRALEVGAPGLAEGGRMAIALNAAVRASDEIEDGKPQTAAKYKKLKVHRRRGRCVIEHLFLAMRAPNAQRQWTIHDAREICAAIGYPGESTGPTILSAGYRLSFLTRTDGLYSLTEHGRALPIEVIVNAINNLKATR